MSLETDYSPIQVCICAVMCSIFIHGLKESCFSWALVLSFAIEMFKYMIGLTIWFAWIIAAGWVTCLLFLVPQQLFRVQSLPTTKPFCKKHKSAIVNWSTALLATTLLKRSQPSGVVFFIHLFQPLKCQNVLNTEAKQIMGKKKGSYDKMYDR